MLQLVYGEKHYKVEFSYPTPGVTWAHLYFDPLPESRDRERLVLIGDGEASIHWRDRPNKDTGRKVALLRALGGMDKAFRSKVWSTYHENIGPLAKARRRGAGDGSTEVGGGTTTTQVWTDPL